MAKRKTVIRFDPRILAASNDGAEFIEVGGNLLKTLVRKNADYGSSAFKSPRLAPWISPYDAVMVRMSDKVERIENLRRKARQQSGLRSRRVNMVNESIDDTALDFAAYALINVINLRRERDAGKTRKKR